MTGHPLDDCDPTECYQTMMSERTELIKARREAEDNLVKTIIQLSSALVVLLAGFAVQSKVDLVGLPYWLFVLATICSAVAIAAGLAEHFYSSKAYLAQQKLVEDYFSKRISSFSEPKENAQVRKAQLAAFASFLVSLGLLGIIAISKAGVSYGQPAASTSASSAAATAAAAAAPATAVRATTTGIGRIHRQGGSDEVGGTVNAATAADQEVSRNGDRGER